MSELRKSPTDFINSNDMNCYMKSKAETIFVECTAF